MAHPALMLRYAARSHVGLVRAKNDDSAYAGRYLAVVADGMGGHAGGDVASASTVLDLIHLDRDDYSGDAGTHLADEIQTANSLLSELVHVNPKLAGMGTTVTSLLVDGSTLAYAHIGDSRAYRLKDGIFEQMSTDHTFVQRMIDEGRMTEAEAEVHPHKNVLMRVLGDVDASPELDLKYFDAEVGERWLLCSDGLNFVRNSMVEEVVRNSKDLETAADTLIELTLAAGSPDNVTVVVFDVVEWAEEESPSHDSTTTALPVLTSDAASLESVSGSTAGDGQKTRFDVDGEFDAQNDKDDDGPQGLAATSAELDESEEDSEESELPDTPELDVHIRAAVVLEELSRRPHELVGAAVTANAQGKIPQLAHHPATRRAATVLTHKPQNTVPEPQDDDNEQSLRLRRILIWSATVLAVVVVVAGSWIAYAWTQTQYFVGVTNGNVAIYKGVSQKLGPITLSHLERETSVSVAGLPEYSQQLVTATMPASSLTAAEQIISDLQLGTGVSTPPCIETPSPSAAATATPSPSPSSSPKPVASSKPTASAKATASAKPSASAAAKSSASPSATKSVAPGVWPTSIAESLAPTCIPGGGK